MADEEHFLVCKSCGAKHAYSPGDQSIKCEFCGTITPLTADYDEVPGLDGVSGIIPLVVDRKAVELALYEQMSLGTYTPEDMIERSQIVSCKAQFFPFYRFDGNYEGTWTASFGYDRTVSYTSWESDGQGNRRPVTRHRTVTDWSPANGPVQGSFSLVGYAGELVDSDTAEFLETHAEISDATSDVRSFSAGITALLPKAHREQEEADNPGLWEFRSSRDPSKFYRVTYGRAGHIECTCEGFLYRGNCKHVQEVRGKTTRSSYWEVSGVNNAHNCEIVLLNKTRTRYRQATSKVTACFTLQLLCPPVRVKTLKIGLQENFIPLR
jgi:LSD1 subclass zinc finger protein